jgi:hypothetical protein
MEIPTNVVKPANGGFDTSSNNAFVLLTSSPAAPARPRPYVDPHSLVHSKTLSKSARAVLGAEILDGRLSLLNPTVAMVAQAVGVNADYIAKARRLSPEQRREVARGRRSLVAHKAAPMLPTPRQRFAGIVSELGGIASARVELATIERNGNGHASGA